MGDNRELRFPLSHYDYSEQIIRKIQPIANLFEKNEFRKGEKEIAKLTLDFCQQIEEKLVEPEEVDKYFTLLEIFLDSNFLKEKLNNETKELLIEGMMLHDWGKSYGGDMDCMKNLANKILREGR